jgi:predicted Zn-dependent peptidase
MVDPARSALAIYGDLPLNQVVTKVQQKLGAWKASGGALPDWPEETHPMGAKREVEVATTNPRPPCSSGRRA